jgi:hypothetical protein
MMGFCGVGMELVSESKACTQSKGVRQGSW